MKKYKCFMILVVMFVLSCNTDDAPQPPFYQMDCIVLDENKSLMTDHMERIIANKIDTLVLAGMDQDIEDVIQEAHNSAVKIYCTRVLIEYSCKERFTSCATGRYKRFEEIQINKDKEDE